MKITKEIFSTYCDIQISGIVNMCNISVVATLMNVTPEVVKDIIHNYMKYREMYPGVYEELEKKHMENLDNM